MCTTISKKLRGSLELGDIFANSGITYIERHGVSAIQHKAIVAISSCRASRLGGHVLCCDHCGALEMNSAFFSMRVMLTGIARFYH